MQGVDWPYDGPDEWIRRTILLGAPALLAIAATLTFWPARRGAAALRIAGLVALLLLYGTAVTEQDPGAPALRGLVLLLLIAAWLWLPRMPRREAGVGAAVVASVGVISLPLAAALDGDRAWWDYHAWSWFGNGESISVRLDARVRPAQLVARRGDGAEREVGPPALLEGRDARLVRRAALGALRVAPTTTASGRRWPTRDRSPRGAGTTTSTTRTGTSASASPSARSPATWWWVPASRWTWTASRGARPSSDGTTRLPPGRRLERGDSYFVRTYAPNPTKAQMEGVVEGYSSDLIRYTEIHLPNRGESATEGVGLQGDAARELAALRRPVVFVPLRGNPDPDNDAQFAERTIRNSPYRRMYDLAQSLTADQPNAYAAVKNVEQYLQSNYTYSERVPTRPIPLMGFLYQERRGYCQQFSGTMALMLRMAGIPARVAAGFSPGSFNKDTDEYRVRDLDAHSWVEVWFQGIGWVPFDPTPARSPAQSQSSALATSAAAADAGEVSQTRQGVAAERGSDTGGALGSEAEGTAGSCRCSCCSWPRRSRSARSCSVRASAACATSALTSSPSCSCPSCGARCCGSAGTCPPPPRCWGSSGGWGASRGPPRRPTRRRCAPIAMTRALRTRPTSASAGSSAGSSPAAASRTGSAG